MTSIAQTRVACNTSTGTQDITNSVLGGKIPTAALFFVTKATSDGTAANTAHIGTGATDGTNQWAMASNSGHGSASTDVARRAMTDECVLIINDDGTVDGEAAFSAFIANGVRINWGNAPGSAYLLRVILFAGNQVQAFAGTVDLTGIAVDGTVDVTDPGFNPQAVIFATHQDDFNDTATDFHRVSFGFAVDDGSDTQRCIVQAEDNGSGSGDPAAYLSTAYAAAQINASAAVVWGAEIGTFDASGFTVTLRLATAGTDEIGYLALDFGSDADVWVGTHATPTSTGNQSSTAPGFEPELVLFGMTQLTAIDTGAVDASAGPYGIGAITADNEYSDSIALEDAAATTNTQSLSDDTAVNLPNDDGTTGIVAAFVSMNSDGWTLNFSSVLGSATQFIALAVNPVATVETAGSITPTGSLLQQVNKLLAGALTPVGTLANSLLAYVTNTGSITPTGDVSNTVTRAQSLAGSITPSGTVSFAISKNLSGSITPSGTLTTNSVTTIEPSPSVKNLMYIEQVKFSEPYSLQLVGGDDHRLGTFLAQRGVKNNEDLIEELRTQFHSKDRPIVTKGGKNVDSVVDNIYPSTDESGTVPVGGVIFWPCDAGTIPLGWQIYTPAQGKFLVGADGVNFICGVDGGALTYDVSHTHGPGTLATDSDAHSHTSGTLATASDNHSHTSGTLATDSDAHTHTSGTLDVDKALVDTVTNVAAGATPVADDTHGHHDVIGSTASDSHSHTVNSGSTAADSHSHSVNSGSTGSDSHSHAVTTGVTASGGSAVQSILPPYHVGTWIQFVGTV